MDPTPRRRPRAITVVAAGLAAFALPTLADGALADEHDALITRADLEDRIRGGMLGQILGNLNGLPHEMKYIHDPGEVTGYVPALPDGARTDDDTDLEWVYVSAIQRRGEPLVPHAEVAQLWRRHINEGIWCANRFARSLMELGFEPPLTGSAKLNPWSSFNLSGQFVCESFGLMAPAMPQTAARVGLHYTQAAVEGEPLETTRLFTTMIAMAFVEPDMDALLDAGVAAVDPRSDVASLVTETRQLHRRHPDDWRAARLRIKQRWQRHNGDVRDWNGYELNTACTVAALLYGRGDVADTLQVAFNLGWDCDNNAATAATIAGMLAGRRRLDAQGWEIKDVYRNTTRPGMPEDETMTSYEDRVIACAEIVILGQGGERVLVDGEPGYRIRSEKLGYVPASSSASNSLPCEAVDDLPQLEAAGAARDQWARAAYRALCCGQADRMAEDHPELWSQAIDALGSYPELLHDVRTAPQPHGAELQNALRRWLPAEPTGP